MDHIKEYKRLLNNKLSFNNADNALSTHYSKIGLAHTSDYFGLDTIFLYYNRKPSTLSLQLLRFKLNGEFLKAQNACQFSSLHQHGESHGLNYELKHHFIESDLVLTRIIIMNDSDQERAFKFQIVLNFSAQKGFLKKGSVYGDYQSFSLAGCMPAPDRRDPAPSFPLRTAVYLAKKAFSATVQIEGKEESESMPFWDQKSSFMSSLGTLPGTVQTDEGLTALFSFEINLTKGKSWELPIFIKIAPGEEGLHPLFNSIKKYERINDREVEYRQAQFWNESLKSIELKKIKKNFQQPYLQAAYSLVNNLVAGHGLLGEHIASFPARGVYCCHFLWDTIFQNFGYMQMNTKFAKDGLLILTENLHQDGKMPMFICATWHRPGVSQPPIVPWGVWELYQRTRDRDLLRQVYEPLSKNMDWWFREKDENKNGLVEFHDGFESGWDDSPRFDEGPIDALDVNSYLYYSLNCLARIARVLRKKEERKWIKKAEQLGKLILEVLYDPLENIFYDLNVKSGEPLKIKTPACFLPLWAGVPLDEGLSRKMIETYLLSPQHFFGDYPFPSVAYSEERYLPGKWWRGPIWPSTAFLMLETLKKWGYQKEYRQSVSALLKMMLSGFPRENYNSQTGEGGGASQQGWSCAFLMHLVQS